MGDQQLSADADVHNYRQSSWQLSAGLWAFFLLLTCLAVLLYLRLDTSPSNDLSRHRPFEAAINFVICMAFPLTMAVVNFLSWRNERVVIDGSEILWRSRFGKIVVRCQLSDVIAWRRVNVFNGRYKYVVHTTAGMISYGPSISRRAELDRLLISMTGEQIPEPVPAPRHWQGRAMFRATRMSNYLAPAMGLFCFALTLRTLGWVDHPFSIAGWRVFLSASALFAGATVGAVLKICLESVSVENEELVIRNYFGKIGAKIRLDDIASVDVFPVGAPSLIYAGGQTFALSPWVEDFNALVLHLQLMTASPNP